MNKISLFLTFLTVVCSTVLLSSCYHVGSLMPPGVDTIAIAPVENNTVEFNVSAEMRQLLSEQFMLDGSLKVVSLEEADCIIYTKITDVAFREVSRDSSDHDMLYLPQEWEVRLQAEFSVIIPGNARQLVRPRKISGTANFQAQADLEVNRRRGIQQAARDAARTIVSYTTEAW